MPRAFAFLEIGTLTPSLVAADRCSKAAGVELVGIESTMGAQQTIKLAGPVADVEAAARAGVELARQMGTEATYVVIPGPDPRTEELSTQPPAFIPLLDIYDLRDKREPHMAHPDALGLIETQGLVAALHATDAMLKASAVELVGKEKIGAAFVTIVVRGDVAAVQAAVEAGRQTVEKLEGKLIMADVITRPHAELLALLPAM